MNQRAAINAIRSADISQDGWLSKIISEFDSQYAKGYMTALTEKLGDSMSQHDSEFQDEALEICCYNIWK